MKEIHFVRYRGFAYPRTHPTKPDQLIPDTSTFYAVPGGGLATKSQCELWGKVRGVKVTFEVRG